MQAVARSDILRKRTMLTVARNRVLLLAGGLAAAGATLVPSVGTADSGHGLPASAIAMPTLNVMQAERAALGSKADCVLPVIAGIVCAGVGTPMTYGNGPIQTAPKVYIVFWGWNGRDPSGQGAYQERFFEGVGGSTWNASQTQYCDKTDAVGLTCTSSANHVGNPNPVFTTANVWSDNTNPVPTNPDDAAIQAEAARAAVFFKNTTAASNANTQYVIDTPQGNSTVGFGTQWCAYHGDASTSSGNLSYTDFPYITDAGGSCGENIVNSGSAGLLDGVSIVGGHEFAESETDVSPPSAWTDTIGAETGDKCAWIQFGPGSVTDISLSTGTFAVQSLYSNNDNSGAGGCVTFYASPSNQH
jgi:serine protease